MTGLEIIHDVRDILTAGAAIVAGVKAWLVNSKAKRIEKDVAEIKVTLAQQQMQKQSQNITVNVGTSNTAGSAKTEAAVIPFEEPPQ
jgi:hypothetical protein